jgi:hypothetical protein
MSQKLTWLNPIVAKLLSSPIKFINFIGMLLQLEDANDGSLKKLLDYASKLKLRLRVIAADKNSLFLPGKALSDNELKAIIESSRKSGVISMKTAHKAIRDSFNED